MGRLLLYCGVCSVSTELCLVVIQPSTAKCFQMLRINNNNTTIFFLKLSVIY